MSPASHPDFLLKVLLTDGGGDQAHAIAGPLTHNPGPNVALSAATPGIRSGIYYPPDEDMPLSVDPVYCGSSSSEDYSVPPPAPAPPPPAPPYSSRGIVWWGVPENETMTEIGGRLLDS